MKRIKINAPHLSGKILRELAPWLFSRLPGFIGPCPSTSLDKVFINLGKE